MMKRVVITGATGAIGIALVNQMIRENVEVLVLCRKESNRNDSIPQHSLVNKKYCSLEELKSLDNASGQPYDVFYHFGWAGTTGPFRNDMHSQLQNVQYTLDAVEAAARLGCQKFVGAGSQAEYGRVEGVLNASTPPFPENGYGIAKLCAGQMSRILCEQKGIQHVWTRILSVYGPNDGNNSMIMSTINKLINNEIPALTKGEQQWDYLYSKDAAKALYLIGLYGKNGKIYCLGSGQTRPLLEYVKVMRDKIDKNAELGVGAIPYGEKQVMHLCADVADLAEDTGFVPDYTFEEGIVETINWYKEERVNDNNRTNV